MTIEKRTQQFGISKNALDVVEKIYEHRDTTPHDDIGSMWRNAIIGGDFPPLSLSELKKLPRGFAGVLLAHERFANEDRSGAAGTESRDVRRSEYP